MGDGFDGQTVLEQGEEVFFVFVFFVEELRDGGNGAVGFVFDDLFDELRSGVEDGAFGQVRTGDLQAVEEQAGTFRVETAAGDALQDKADRSLDGAAVLGERQVEDGTGVGVGGDGFGLARLVVVEAEGFAAETLAAAAVAVGKDVAALVWIFGCHKLGTPLP